MSDDYSIDTFLPHVGEVFRVRTGDGREVPLLLSEITQLHHDGSPRRQRQPFSLVFHGTPGTGIEQQIYVIDGPGTGPFECFLVPIGPDAYGMRYEVIYA